MLLSVVKMREKFDFTIWHLEIAACLFKNLLQFWLHHHNNPPPLCRFKPFLGALDWDVDPVSFSSRGKFALKCVPPPSSCRGPAFWNLMVKSFEKSLKAYVMEITAILTQCRCNVLLKWQLKELPGFKRHTFRHMRDFRSHDLIRMRSHTFLSPHLS